MDKCSKCGCELIFGYEQVVFCKLCASKTLEVQSASARQLKTEIADLADKLHFAYNAADMDYKTIAESIEKLRQLSAI